LRFINQRPMSVGALSLSSPLSFFPLSCQSAGIDLLPFFLFPFLSSRGDFLFFLVEVRVLPPTFFFFPLVGGRSPALFLGGGRKMNDLFFFLVFSASFSSL